MIKDGNKQFERDFAGEAVLEYGDADFMILSPGSYVICAVTGEKINIHNLRYWNPVLQEAYKDGETATKRWRELEDDVAHGST